MQNADHAQAEPTLFDVTLYSIPRVESTEEVADHHMATRDDAQEVLFPELRDGPDAFTALKVIPA